ncbi:hypothetical protein D3C81_1993900 [compost metagenome]
MVRCPLLSAALNTPPVMSSTTEVRIGVDGATVSTLRINPLDAGPTFPAASVAMAVKTCWPLPSVVDRNSQVPSIVAVTVVSSVPLS